MPDVEVWHLSDMKTPPIPGTDKQLKRPADIAHLMTMRLQMYSLLPEEDWLFLDTDVIVQRDVSWIFHNIPLFDVAALKRSKIMVSPPGFEGFPELTGKDLTESMPFNTGVIFSRSKALWEDAYAWLKLQDERYHKWFGDQCALRFAINDMRYQFYPLTPELNYTPKFPDEDVSQKFIVHYKGPRKSWMLAR